jgi:hypothetical protein
MKNEEDLSSAFSPLCAFASLRENFPVSFFFSAFSFPPLAFLHLRRYHQKKRSAVLKQNNPTSVKP